MGLINYISQDAEANRNNTKGKQVTKLFRLAAYVSRSKTGKMLCFPYLAFYRFFVEWVLGIELPWETKVGKGLRIYHGQSIVVHKHVVMGENCVLRQCTTIGNTKDGGKAPMIGNNVEIGSNVCILGEITIGDNVVIGAGSVVVKSVPPNSVVVGNPAKVIKTIDSVVYNV